MIFFNSVAIWKNFDELLNRLITMNTYSKDAEKRGPGMLITAAANIALIAGGLVGALIAIL